MFLGGVVLEFEHDHVAEGSGVGGFLAVIVGVQGDIEEECDGEDGDGFHNDGSIGK